MEESESKEKILKGAMELFMRYGVRSVSMDDIARHLGISKKTIYQYFADKEDVITMGSKVHMEKIKGEFDEIHDNAKNSIDELVNISAEMKKIMQNLNPSMMFDLQKYHPRAWAVWLDHKNQSIRSSVVKNLKQGIEEGYFRPDLNTDIIANLRLEQVQIAFDDRVFPHDSFNISQVQVQIFEHFVYGLLTENGRKLYDQYKQEKKELELIPTPKHN